MTTHVLLVGGALIFESEWNQVPPGFVPDRLARRLTRAPRRWQSLQAPWADGAAHLEWLARAFAVPTHPPVCAPYSWKAAGGPGASDAPKREVWFCDPVHLSLQPERTVLAPIDSPALSEAESRELFLDAADAASEHGGVLQQAAGRWYLLPNEPWDLKTMPLEAVLGASIETRLPQGARAAHWRRLLNDVQMRWHANPVNRQRESRGQQPANGLWLHGGGSWSVLPPSRFAQVRGDDMVVQGWQQAADVSKGRVGSDSLTVWPGLFEPYWRRNWSAWATAWSQLDQQIDSLLRAPASGVAGSIELVACGRQGAATFMLSRSASLLPWRRRALRDCLLESTNP